MKKIYTIGRDTSCDIVIIDPTDVISRLHATIRVESNKKIYITDQSRNGTFINGMKMSSNVEIPVSREDVISFAHIYNFDWNTIPKEKNNFLSIVLYAVLAAVIIGGAIFFVTNYKKGGNTPVDNQNTIIQPADSTQNTIPADSTITVSDTVKVKEKDNNVVNKSENKKETPKEEEKPKEEEVPVEEEIIDPIY